LFSIVAAGLGVSKPFCSCSVVAPHRFFSPFLLAFYRGTLIIVTDDAQWSYEVRGAYPSNVINQATVKSKVDSNRHGSVTAFK
jgi:hypothetical protein